MTFRALSVLWLLSLPVLAAEDPAAKDPSLAADKPAAIPAVVKIDETRFRLGEVEFDHKTRAIRFPAAINMREGLLEYAIVHENGKVHESLLQTKVNPSHLNIAFKLLRYQASPELFPVPNDDGSPSDRMPQVDAQTRAAARVSIRILWKEEQTEKSATLNEWIANSVTELPMPPGPWIYNGSLIYEGQFQAEMTGDIAAIFSSQCAMLNYPGKDNSNDDVWTPLTKRIPPEGTRVTVEFTPWKP